MRQRAAHGKMQTHNALIFGGTSIVKNEKSKELYHLSWDTSSANLHAREDKLYTQQHLRNLALPKIMRTWHVEVLAAILTHQIFTVQHHKRHDQLV